MLVFQTKDEDNFLFLNVMLSIPYNCVMVVSHRALSGLKLALLLYYLFCTRGEYLNSFCKRGRTNIIQ